MIYKAFYINFMVSQIELKSDLKKSPIYIIWGQSDPLLSQNLHPWLFKLMSVSPHRHYIVKYYVWIEKQNI